MRFKPSIKTVPATCGSPHISTWSVGIVDGAFVHYKYEAGNPKSLGPGNINTIGEDAPGDSWFGTNNGICLYDRSTDTFTRFSQNQAILKIYRDHQGEVWVGTNTGLWQFENSLQEKQQPALNRYGLDGAVITAIHENQQGALWVGTALWGLNRLDRATGEFTRFNNNQLDPTSLSDNYVSSILEDGSGRLWIGTNNGLNLFDPATGGFFITTMTQTTRTA